MLLHGEQGATTYSCRLFATVSSYVDQLDVIMLIIISPAKTLDYQSPLATDKFTQPQLLDQSQALIKICRTLTPSQIASLMGISDKLATLNTVRFNEWHPEFTLENARQAILAFKGDLYSGLQAIDFTDADFGFAQSHLRILSGLYGLLRPLDLMQPYRLEMGTKLTNPRGKDLYAFWRYSLNEQLNQALEQQGDDVLINLASDEYFKAVDTKKLTGKLIKPVFLDEKSGKYKVISFYAKKARGLMSRFIIQNRLSKVEQLLDFDLQGYRFDPLLSLENQLVFKRPEHRSLTTISNTF